MGIYSIGVDLADIKRFQEIINRYDRRFLERVFTDQEIDYCYRRATFAHSFAARFAAKEAVFKATGSGLRAGMCWKDVEVINDEQGKPEIRLSGGTGRMLAGKKVHLSLSHADNFAIAMVVVEDR